MTIDILAMCAHPDDAELTCAGLLLRAKQEGASIGVVDFTRGEMGSRGTALERDRESAAAAEVLGLDLRLNLGLADGGIRRDEETIVKLVEVIREHRPGMLLAPYWEDHHPDHVNTSLAVKDAWWFAGVAKYPAGGEPHRPEGVLYYLARYLFRPSLIVDVSDVYETKVKAVQCYRSQLYSPGAEGPATYISAPDFMGQWEARHRYYGSLIGVRYGEAYLMRTPVPVYNPLNLLIGRPGYL